jgi:amino acid adenylation domain-containing protein
MGTAGHEATVSARSEALSAKKRKLLSRLLREEGVDLSRLPMTSLDRDDEDLPLSFAQERLWFLDRLTPDSPAYNVPLVVRFNVSIDIGALERSLTEITRRHEVLRATFPASDGQPSQVIAKDYVIALPVVDLRALSEGERQSEAQRLAREEALAPFDLARGPLLRVVLLRLHESESLLLLTMHHVVTDGHSVDVLLRELDTLYGAFARGERSPLPDLPVQYVDFAAWQRIGLESEGAKQQLDYWKRKLSELPTLGFPTDRARPAVARLNGARQTRVLRRELTQALKELSRRDGATLFMTLLAGFMVLLHRYTGEDDIVLGSPVANRRRAETKDLIGCFVNMLVVRSDVSGTLTFSKHLARVRSVVSEALAHQDLPFEKIVEELHPQRGLNRNPLFQITLALHGEAMQPRKTEHATLVAHNVDLQTTRFDLEVHVTEGNDGCLGLDFVYSTDLFEHTTIRRMSGHYGVLLEGIVADPDQRLCELPLLTSAEHEQLLGEWNRTDTDYSRQSCVHELFAAQARRTPESVAVVCRREELTYHELNVRANQLAHHLQKLGVGPDVLVGVCVERSLEMVVALLGILKAGGAYVPLDPSYPEERLAWMLADSRAPVLLTDDGVGDVVWAEEGTRVLYLDREWELFGHESEANPPRSSSSENLAYVIYTSGSTGRPKGVAIQHDGLLNLVTWHQRVYELTSADRATQLASVAFDASVWELWPALAAGATIYIPDDETRAEPASLIRWLVANEITISFVPTPLAEAMLAEAWPTDVALRVLLTGGDRLHRGPDKELPFRLVNHYGPTENTVVATSADVAAGALAPPIGRPIANTQAYVLDSHMQPVPVGAVGELFLGGSSLARGYWRRRTEPI